MKSKITVPYKLRRILPILGIAGLTILPSGCKPQNEPENPNKTTPDTTITTNPKDTTTTITNPNDTTTTNPKDTTTTTNPKDTTTDLNLPDAEMELRFGPTSIWHIEEDTIKKYLGHAQYHYTIYLRIWPAYGGEQFAQFTSQHITNWRKMLESRCNLAPERIFGRGDFTFKPGVASQVPADSLYLVSRGWTINKQKQR